MPTYHVYYYYFTRLRPTRVTLHLRGRLPAPRSRRILYRVIFPIYETRFVFSVDYYCVLFYFQNIFYSPFALSRILPGTYCPKVFFSQRRLWNYNWLTQVKYSYNKYSTIWSFLVIVLSKTLLVRRRFHQTNVCSHFVGSFTTIIQRVSAYFIYVNEKIGWFQSLVTGKKR